MTDSTLTAIASILALLAAAASGYAAFRARPLSPELGENLRELTLIVQAVLSGIRRPMKTLKDKLHREGSFQEVNTEFVVAIDLIEDTLSTEYEKASKWEALDFQNAILDAAAARLWIGVAMTLALLSAAIQLFVVFRAGK